MGQNCMASASIGCIFCCQGCNAEKLRNAFTFLPPQNSYTIQDESNGEEAAANANSKRPGPVSGVGRMVYLNEALKGYSFYQQAAEHAEVRFLRTRRGERIPIAWIRPSGSSCSTQASTAPEDQPIVLIYCHGNAADIGMMMGPYFELSKQLNVEVVGVEYSGYGMASGKPSTKNTHADIEAAYDYVRSRGVPPERIVAYGQSVGSGPVMGLASKKQLGGIVLHSPMLSGIKVIDPEPYRCCRPSCVYRCFDFFHNDRAMRKLECPGFVIHGQLDDIIPFYHGERLMEVTPKQHQWPGYFPRAAGHNDIVELNAAAYFGEVSSFIRAVEHRAKTGAEWIEKPPKQVEMDQPKKKFEIDHSRTPHRRCEIGVDPSEWERNKKAAAASLQYKEPAVGPEDGRYSAMRGAKLGKQDGDARELRTIPVM